MSAERTELDVPVADKLRIRRDVLGAGGLIVGSAVLALSGGPLGLATALVFLLAGLLVPPLLAFAGGQLLLLAVTGSPSPVELAVFQLGLFAILTETLRIGETGSRPTIVSAAILCLLGLGVAFLVGQASLLWAAISLAAGTAVLIYGGHRYVLVTLNVPNSMMDTNDDRGSDE